MQLIPVSRDQLKAGEKYIFILSKRDDYQIISAKLYYDFHTVINLRYPRPLSIGDNRNRELYSENKNHNLCMGYNSSIKGNYKLNIQKLPFELSELILSYL